MINEVEEKILHHANVVLMEVDMMAFEVHTLEAKVLAYKKFLDEKETPNSEDKKTKKDDAKRCKLLQEMDKELAKMRDTLNLYNGELEVLLPEGIEKIEFEDNK